LLRLWICSSLLCCATSPLQALRASASSQSVQTWTWRRWLVSTERIRQLHRRCRFSLARPTLSLSRSTVLHSCRAVSGKAQRAWMSPVLARTLKRERAETAHLRSTAMYGTTHA
jgi:hypothetical protein